MADQDERIARLERRLAVVEGLLRQALNSSTPSAAPPLTGQITPVTRRPLRERLAETTPSALPPAAPRRLLGEEWLGQRGLLALGVLCTILAAGFLLRFAIDQGWISPLVRCLVGGVVGVGLSLVGWREYRKHLRTYGVALIGLGAAVVYLAVWAAGARYGLLSVTAGQILLALISYLLAAAAFMLRRELLAIVAIGGAFLAPLLLDNPAAGPTALVLYLVTVVATIGGVAHAWGWQRTMLLLLIGWGILGGEAMGDPLTGALLATASALGVGLLGIHSASRHGWTGIRLLASAVAWYHLAMVSTLGGNAALYPLMASSLLIYPIWQTTWRTDDTWPVAPRPAGLVEGQAWVWQQLTFALQALGLVIVFGPALAQITTVTPVDAFLVVGLGLLAASYGGRRAAPGALLGAAVLAVGTLGMGFEPLWGMILLLLTIGVALLDHLLGRRDGRWSAVMLMVPLVALVADSMPSLSSSLPAFLHPWALVTWGTVVTLVLLARGLWCRTPMPFGWYPEEPPPENGLGQHLVPRMVTGLWSTAAVLLWGGVSFELVRAAHQIGLTPEAALLAAGLAVSVWWACCAAALLVHGFRYNQRVTRTAGLIGALVVVAKVLLIDLASLDALYRVGSLVVTALLLLVTARRYHVLASRLPEGEADPPGM